jgi:outer membrane translocation and assembly module TamA
VLAGRVRAGAIYGDLPISERLFSGGASNHRGFGERMLAPFVTETGGTEIPYGGAALLETGLEARVRIGTVRKMPLGGVVFLDGGDVTSRVSELDLDNLHWAAGVGLRLHTIVGPVRADLGYRLNRTGPTQPDPDSRFAFHLSLGEAF